MPSPAHHTACLIGLACVVASASANADPAAPSTSLSASTTSGAPGAAASPAAPPAPPPAPPAKRVAWHPAWRRFDTQDAFLTGASTAGIAAFVFFGKESPPDYRGPVLFDARVREGIRADSPRTRENAEKVGDKLYQGLVLYPFVVDVLAVTLIAHRASDVAGQMALIDAEAFAITGFLGFAANAGIRRQRPDQPGCTATGGDAPFPGCRGNGEGDTFFSGRTSIAVTGAALTCMHHAYLPLYGQSRVGDVAACATAIAAGASAGAIRLVADQHYSTDVIVGAAIGATTGVLVPWLHYRGGPRAFRERPASALHVQWVPAPMLTASSAGLGAVGSF